VATAVSDKLNGRVQSADHADQRLRTWEKPGKYNIYINTQPTTFHVVVQISPTKY